MTLNTPTALLAGIQDPRTMMKAVTGTLVAGVPKFLGFLAGAPGAVTWPTPGVGGEQLTTLAGMIPFANPASGETRLTSLEGMAGQAGEFTIMDILAHYTGFDVTLTTEQVCTGAVTIPSRDRNGSNAGDGVVAGILVTSALGAGTPTVTMKYTNQVGTTGQTATNITSIAASSAQGTLFLMGLAAGDTGVRKIESITLSATMTSGAIVAILFRKIATIGVSLANTANFKDGLALNFAKLYNNSVLFPYFIPNTTSSVSTYLSIGWSQG